MRLLPCIHGSQQVFGGDAIVPDTDLSPRQSVPTLLSFSANISDAEVGREPCTLAERPRT